MTPVDYSDIQGLLRFGFGKLPETRYLLVRIRDAAAVRAWLRTSTVTTAEERNPPPETALQVAFTISGLRSLRVPEHVCSGFSAEFCAGMAADASRSRRLGDAGENAPEKWTWGHSEDHVDALVMLFAARGLMEGWERQVRASLFDSAFDIIVNLATSDLDGREPFGFIDGISQPEIDWERRRNTSGDKTDFTNSIALGEFLLGYPNEYGKYTDRPVLELSEDGASELPLAENDPGKRDLGRNGTYLVMRQLEQDVQGFWSFLQSVTKSEEERTRLAEQMVGRRLSDGAPLAAVDDSGNRFTYENDPEGTRCPFGAHIRRANPRTADMPGHPAGLLSRTWAMLGGRGGVRDDLIASSRFHRILRRGREYGSSLTQQQALQRETVYDGPRGIHFVGLNANIARQFEFIQNAWISSGKFNGLADESDPLLGGGDGRRFSAPREGSCPQAVTGLPQFVTVRGGGYFFLPGLQALKYLSRPLA